MAKIEFGVSAMQRHIGASPRDRQAQVVGAARPWRFGSQAILDVDADEALSREPVQHVVVDFAAEALVATYEDTAVNEHHDGCIGDARGREQIEDLPRMRAVCDVTRHCDAGLGGSVQQWSIRTQHHVTICLNVPRPYRADFHHQLA